MIGMKAPPGKTVPLPFRAVVMQPPGKLLPGVTREVYALVQEVETAP